MPELLECVLVQLGDLDKSSWTRLFEVRRVSKMFQAVIKSSPTLRQRMLLEAPKTTIIAPELPNILDAYRAFFAAIQCVLFPFWCHLRPSTGPEALVLAMNVSLSWNEESPGVMVGRAPCTLDGSKAIEQSDSWRNILVPYFPQYAMELQCCGYPVDGSITEGQTLGELADKAIDAGKEHLVNLTPVMYYG